MAAARVKAPCTLHVPADATELSDPVTTALALARMVAADPGSAPRAVATLLHARLVDPAAAPAPDLHTHPIRVGAQHLLLGRAWPFTATELSRAAALLELSAQLSLAAPAPEPTLDTMLLLHDGSEVLLREAGPSDVPLVDALHARCSPASRRARFLSPTPRLDPDQLRALVDPAGGRSVLALTRDGGSAVGLADLRLVDPSVAHPAASPAPPSVCWWKTRGSTGAWAPRWCGGSRRRPWSSAWASSTAPCPPTRSGSPGCCAAPACARRRCSPTGPSS